MWNPQFEGADAASAAMATLDALGHEGRGDLGARLSLHGRTDGVSVPRR